MRWLMWVCGTACAAAAQAQPSSELPPEAGERAVPQRVEVRGARPTDVEERRQSTAAKIVVGRDEIERYGDTSLGDVLKRLPGVTVPGRDAAPRMRGLGSGYTQILLDGQRLPRGFSLDALSPEQVERIEILRAPTAETGARAIAGTINIVTREGSRRRSNELRVALGVEDGRAQPNLNWNHNDSAGALSYNVFGALFASDRDSSSRSVTLAESLDDGGRLREWHEEVDARNRRQGLRLGARLQWRLGDSEALTLAPFVIRSRSDGERKASIERVAGETALPYALARSDSDGRFELTRLNTQWRHLVGGTRVEWNANGWHWRSDGSSHRDEFDAAFAPSRTLDERSTTRQRTLALSSKATRLLDNDHQLVGGAEVEAVRRDESRVTLQDGVPLLPEFGADLAARSTRWALYLQDEWQGSPRWALHAGARWESIATRGDSGGTDEATRNDSHVFTPLLHAVFKPDPKGRDQLRISLTRSYRTPALGQLIARPSISTLYPLPGGNEPTSPDRAGNPALRPELATGIDVALERYLEGGGVLSANLFHRRIADLVRHRTALETVSWSALPRWVSRPVNVGDATTSGIELEAKLRLADWLPDAPRVDLRATLGAYRSRVDGVAGPDDRLDEQPDLTANLGADWRVDGVPLTLGGNLNLTPGYRTRLADTEVVEASRRRVFDAYALWIVNPSLQWRLSASNLAPLDARSLRAVDAGTLRETVTTVSAASVSWQLRLEMRL